MLESLAIGLALLGLGAIIVLLRRRQGQRAQQAGQDLLLATEGGNLAEMQAFLRRGAEINARNAQGWTPLHVAAAGGDPAVVALLLQHGADVQAQSYIGTTPLDTALSRGGKKAVTDLLRAHGTQATSPWDDTIL